VTSGFPWPEESWITSRLVLGLKDPFSKERLMEREQSLEKTLQAADLAEIRKQHMKSLKEGSMVFSFDSSIKIPTI